MLSPAGSAAMGPRTRWARRPRPSVRFPASGAVPPTTRALPSGP